MQYSLQYMSALAFAIACFFWSDAVYAQGMSVHNLDSTTDHNSTLIINPHQAPCRKAKQLWRLGLVEDNYSTYIMEHEWTPVFGDNIPLSDIQLAWLAGDIQLARSISDEIEARGGRVFGGLLGTGIGVGISMVGWTLFGSKNVSPQVSAPIGVGGLVIAAISVLYTAHALQAPLEPYLTPTPKHRLSRQEAYRLIKKINAKRDKFICGDM